jgi:hypothetical protein
MHFVIRPQVLWMNVLTMLSLFSALVPKLSKFRFKDRALSNATPINFGLSKMVSTDYQALMFTFYLVNSAIALVIVLFCLPSEKPND